MTRKDYILIADAIKAAHDRINTTVRQDIFEDEQIVDAQLRGVRRTAARIADALGRDNPRFDAGRFLTACGYGA